MLQTTLYLTYSTTVFRRCLLSPTPLTMEDTLPEKLSNLFVSQLISRGVGMQNFKCKALSITASDQPSPACELGLSCRPWGAWMKGNPTPILNRHCLWCFSMCTFISSTSQPFKEAPLKFHFKDEESGTLWQLSDFFFKCMWLGNNGVKN